MNMNTALFVFFFELSVCISATPDFLDVNLLDEVNTTSAETKLSTWRVASRALQSASISWIAKPPYLLNDKLPGNEYTPGMLQSRKARGVAKESKDSNEESGVRTGKKNNFLRRDFNVKGIFQEIVSKGLQICGRINPENISYTKKANDLQQLDQKIVKKEADLAMPVHGIEDGFYGGHTYVEVLKSPGVVFIVNKQHTLEVSRKRVLQAMKETWPVVVITMLLAGFAGLLIWGLVSKITEKILILFILVS